MKGAGGVLLKQNPTTNVRLAPLHIVTAWPAELDECDPPIPGLPRHSQADCRHQRSALATSPSRAASGTSFKLKGQKHRSTRLVFGHTHRPSMPIDRRHAPYGASSTILACSVFMLKVYLMHLSIRPWKAFNVFTFSSKYDRHIYRS